MKKLTIIEDFIDDVVVNWWLNSIEQIVSSKNPWLDKWDWYEKYLITRKTRPENAYWLEDYKTSNLWQILSIIEKKLREIIDLDDKLDKKINKIRQITKEIMIFINSISINNETKIIWDNFISNWCMKTFITQLSEELKECNILYYDIYHKAWKLWKNLEENNITWQEFITSILELLTMYRSKNNFINETIKLIVQLDDPLVATMVLNQHMEHYMTNKNAHTILNSEFFKTINS